MVKALLIGLLAFLALSLAGALHPVGDSFAVFRVPLIVMVAVTAVFVRPRHLSVGLILVMGAGLAGHLWQARPQHMTTSNAPPGFVLYQQNFLWNRGSLGQAFTTALQATKPDAVTLQEISDRNRVLLETLAQDYPTQLVCPFGRVGGPAILSPWPKVAGSEICVTENRMAALQLDTPHGTVWVVSIHLRWPWPDGQRAQVAQLVPVLAQLQGDVIIGGDFNAVAWSHSLGQIANAAGVTRVGPYSTTFHLSRLQWPLGIDHVLSHLRAIDVRVMPKFASDHHGVLVQFEARQD